MRHKLIFLVFFNIRRWPTSRERNREYWQGPVPLKTIALARTHAVVTDPKPARKDSYRGRIGLPLYIISGTGIWKVTPDGKILTNC